MRQRSTMPRAFLRSEQDAGGDDGQDSEGRQQAIGSREQASEKPGTDEKLQANCGPASGGVGWGLLLRPGFEPDVGGVVEEDPDKDQQDEGVNGDLAEGVVEAEADVEGDPGDGEPARPVVAAEDEDAGDHEDEFEAERPGVVGMPAAMHGEVRDEADGAGQDEKPAKDGEDEGAFGHGQGSCEQVTGGHGAGLCAVQ